MCRSMKVRDGTFFIFFRSRLFSTDIAIKKLYDKESAD